MEPQQPTGQEPQGPAPGSPPQPPATPPPAAQPPAGAQPPAAAPPPSWSTAEPAAAPPGWKSDPVPVGPAPGVEFGGYGGRLVAYILDVIILGIVIGLLTIILIAILVATVASEGDVGPGGALFAVTLTGMILLVSVLYFPYFWQRSGMTPGMQVFGIKVVRDRDGGPVGWGSAILRWFGLVFIDSIVFGIPIGLLWVFFDRRRRAWHDLLGGTVVIKA